jgi:hypothetical protein
MTRFVSLAVGTLVAVFAKSAPSQQTTEWPKPAVDGGTAPPAAESSGPAATRDSRGATSGTDTDRKPSKKHKKAKKGASHGSVGQTIERDKNEPPPPPPPPK